MWRAGLLGVKPMKKLRPIVAKAIASMRDASGLSRADVATLTAGAAWPFENITLRRLTRFECGQSFPSLPSLASLMVAYSPDQATLNFGRFQSYLEDSAREVKALQSLFVFPSENPKVELILIKLADLESRMRELEQTRVSDAFGWNIPKVSKP